MLDGVNTSFDGVTTYALGSDGTLVYSRRLERAAPMVRLDRSGNAVGTLGDAFDGVTHGPPRFSPDGAFVAVCRHPVGGSDQVVIHDLRRGATTTLGGGGDSRFPVWTPDGTRLAFASTRNGTFDIFEVAGNLGGAPRPLLTREGDQVAWSWTPDGKVLAFMERAAGAGTLDIWVLPRDGEPSPLLANRAFSEVSLAFSLDGRFLAYASDESGRFEVYVQAYPTTDGRITVSTGGGRSPAWARDGLYYTDLDGRTIFFMSFSGAAGLPEDATPQPIMRLPGGRDGEDRWGVSPDGQAFVVLQDYRSPPGSLELVLNWFEELTRLVPTR